MCGIAALWGDQDPKLIRTMTQRLHHRGPDGQGLLECADTATVLGHSRLAIIDPAGGAQPIVHGGRAIAANGEIYNYRRLRAGLGGGFKTNSDSEVILRLYERHGSRAVDYLDGMYVFVIQDGDQIFAARDPLGIKPLYYGRRGEAWVFASELKALVGMAESIREFPPGHWFHSAQGFRRFYRLPEPGPDSAEDTDYWVKTLRDTLERAVEKWMVSDVPVGAFLSGGLDSSIIAALARRHNAELHTFAVGVAGSPDLAAARQVAAHIQSHHHEQVFTVDEVRESLPRIIHALESDDVDLVRSAIPCHFVSALAAQQVKAVLTGEGADELFAGYDYYRDYETGPELARELTRSLASMHNINLQRVDRLTMDQGLEGRVPFLDSELLALAQRIPVSLKLRTLPDGRRIEKWILRAATEDLLPRDIVWRDKLQFDQGSGTTDVIQAVVNQAAGRLDAFDDPRRGVEKALYRGLLIQAYDDARPILDNIGTWTDNRVAA